MLKVFKTEFEDEIKCGGCNYRAYTHYKVEENPTIDIDDNEYSNGLCAQCFMDTIVDEEILLTNKVEARGIFLSRIYMDSKMKKAQENGLVGDKVC